MNTKHTVNSSIHHGDKYIEYQYIEKNEKWSGIWKKAGHSVESLYAKENLCVYCLNNYKSRDIPTKLETYQCLDRNGSHITSPTELWPWGFDKCTNPTGNCWGNIESYFKIKYTQQLRTSQNKHILFFLGTKNPTVG